MRARAAQLLPLKPGAATLYAGVLATASVIAGLEVVRDPAPNAGDWQAFAVFAAAAALAQVFSVRTGRGQAFHTAIAFVTAGVIGLPLQLVLLMVVVQHVPEWLKERYRWYVPPFNVANFAISAWAARVVAAALGAHAEMLPHGPRTLAVVAGVALVFVTVNHVLLAALLWLHRGIRPRESGLFAVEGTVVDLSLGAFGVVLAALWIASPWLFVAIVAPLGLAYRTFRADGLLRESEERFRTLFDAAPLGMAVHGLDGTIVSSNRALRELLGDADPRTLLASTDAQRREELDTEVVAGVRPGYSIEQRYRLPSGEDVFAQVDTALVRDAAERPQFLISMTQDVTARRRLEEQLSQSQKMEAIGRLAGGVAHDFNNLLTAISGYADFAQQRVRESDSALCADLGEIEKAAKRAHELTRQLLAFGRKQLLEPQVLDLNDVVSDAERMLRRLIGENIEVVTVYGGNLGRVRADPGQLNQVIVNLVVNARDEMPDGGTLTIESANRTVSELEARRHGPGAHAGSFVTLSIRDTGRGMDAATKTHLFEPFFTRKEVGKGTGLGLSTVDGIVSQSGGFIDVESEPGRGAAFTIFLPSLGAVAEPDAPEPEPELVRERSAHDPESILIVEDDESVRRYAEAVLLGAGYRVVAAPTGTAAIELARHEHFDLLLADVIMPKLSGTELAVQLGLPTVFMSGYTGDIVERHGMLAASGRLIQKPFSAAELARQVRAALDDSIAEPPVQAARPLVGAELA